MAYSNDDRAAWEWFNDPSSAAPDESLDQFARELSLGQYDGEGTPPPSNPHARVDAVASEAAREAAKELASRKRAAAEQAAKDALAAGASREQAQEAARTAVAALEAEAQAKAAQYAADHPAASSVAPAAVAAPASEADELAAFNAAMTGTAPTPGEGTADTSDDLAPDPWLAAADEARQREAGPDLSSVPERVHPLALAMHEKGLDPAAHADLLEEAAELLAQSIVGFTHDAEARINAVNDAAKALGLEAVFE